MSYYKKVFEKLKEVKELRERLDYDTIKHNIFKYGSLNSPHGYHNNCKRRIQYVEEEGKNC